MGASVTEMGGVSSALGGAHAEKLLAVLSDHTTALPAPGPDQRALMV